MGDHEPGDPPEAHQLRADDLPYRSELLANLSALILLWNAPALQGRILAATGEALDQPAHAALRLLLAWGPRRPTAIADALGTGASHVSKIVRRLENDGLVTRSADPTDRRASLIALTPDGRDAARHIYVLGDRMIADVLAGWPASDVRRYTDLSERFVGEAIVSAERMLERGLGPPAS